MGICSFILASQEPWCGAVCWIQVWISPTGFFYIRLHRETSITLRRCLSLSRFQRATEITSPVNLRNGLCASETRLLKCYNTNLPLYNYMPSGKILALYLHNLVWSGPLRHTKHFAHNSAKLVCVSVTELQNVVIGAYGQSAISSLVFFMVG